MAHKVTVKHPIHFSSKVDGATKDFSLFPGETYDNLPDNSYIRGLVKKKYLTVTEGTPEPEKKSDAEQNKAAPKQGTTDKK